MTSPKVFERVHGLRHRVHDPVLFEPSDGMHQETKLFMLCEGGRTELGAWVFFERRSRFAYEIVSDHLALRWRLVEGRWAPDTGELRPDACVPVMGTLEVPVGIPEVAERARAQRGFLEGWTSRHGLIDGEDFIARDARHLRAHRDRGAFWQRPVWFLYENPEPRVFFEVAPGGKLVAWSRAGTLREPTTQSLKDLELQPVLAIPTLVSLFEALKARRPARSAGGARGSGLAGRRRPG
jgi:hypothetical protein